RGIDVPAQLRTARPFRRRVDLIARDGYARNVADVVMARVARGHVPAQGIRQTPHQADFQALVPGGGAADVVAVAVLEDAIFLVVVIGGDTVADLVASGAVANLHALQLLGVQVGHHLAALQAI